MFVRRYSALPSLSVLSSVSGVVIVDSPAASSQATPPFGTICVVGEFEDGPFNTPTRISSAASRSGFGGFGYTYGSSKYQYPCALRSGGSEYFNGNAFVQIANKTFGGLVFCRVDTSIGEVTFTPRAFTQSTLKPPFVLANGLTFIYSANGASDVTVTFSATAASLTGTGGVFSNIVGGETLQIGLDGANPVTVIFQSGDNNVNAVVSRINATLGLSVASVSGTQLKLTSTTQGTGSSVTVVHNSTSAAFGLTSGSNVTVYGTGDAYNIAQMTFAELKTKIEANPAVQLTQSSDGFVRLVSKTAGSGTIQVKNGTANAALGFVAQSSPSTAALSKATTIPAGTRVRSGSNLATRVVTMISTDVAAGTTNPVSIKVRPAVDDGSYAGVSANAIDTLEDRAGDFEWSVSNPNALSAALTAAQIDDRYRTAINATLGYTDPVKKSIDGIVSARQSNAIRTALRQNAIDATSLGHNARMAFICPPNGTTAAQAQGNAAPGVGAYRSELVVYCLGSQDWQLPELIEAGYADKDGNVVCHPDVGLAARWSCLTPGFNPAQLPEDPALRYPPSVCTGLGDECKSWDVSTYASFKTSGISASFYDENGLTYEQGVTSVDPAVDSAKTSIARQTLAGFYGNFLAGFKTQSKRQLDPIRRNLILTAIEAFQMARVQEKTVEPGSFDQKYVGQQGTAEIFSITAKRQNDANPLVFMLNVTDGTVKLGG